MEVCDIIQEGVINTIPKKNTKKAKWLSEEALQIAEKRIEAKEFQRIARKDKKAFLNEQCKEIKEN